MCFSAVVWQVIVVGWGARLSGVNVNRMRAGWLISAGVTAAFAGVLYTGMRGASAPSSSLAFFWPAFAAAFLGSTAIYPGRFNAPGAFIAGFFYQPGSWVSTVWELTALSGICSMVGFLSLLYPYHS